MGEGKYWQGRGEVLFFPPGVLPRVGNVPKLSIGDIPDSLKRKNAPKGPLPRGTYVTPEVNRKGKK